jgi:hypothetical protein
MTIKEIRELVEKILVLEEIDSGLQLNEEDRQIIQLLQLAVK